MLRRMTLVRTDDSEERIVCNRSTLLPGDGGDTLLKNVDNTPEDGIHHLSGYVVGQESILENILYLGAAVVVTVVTGLLTVRTWKPWELLQERQACIISSHCKVFVFSVAMNVLKCETQFICKTFELFHSIVVVTSHDSLIFIVSYSYIL
jgi:hypothetical protein